MTLTDPRMDAWTRRRVTLDKLAVMRCWRASMCDCSRCGNADRIEEIDALIQRAVEAVQELTEVCSTRPVLVSG